MRAPLAILAAALLLAAGCGGDEKSEKTPAEKLEEAVDGYEEAVENQDCEAFASYAHSAIRPPGKGPDDPPDAEECRNLGQSYTQLFGFKSRRTKVYGSAAIVEGQVQGRFVALIWTLDDGRWTQVQATPGIDPQIAGQPRPEDDFAENAAGFVEAQRKGDCARVFALLNAASPFVEQAQDNEKRFCERYRESRAAPERLATQLSGAPATVKPTDLGGTKDLHFFGLDTGQGRRWTLIMSTLPLGVQPGRHAQDSVLDYYPNTR